MAEISYQGEILNFKSGNLSPSVMFYETAVSENILSDNVSGYTKKLKGIARKK
jgi:hypothetical protein